MVSTSRNYVLIYNWPVLKFKNDVLQQKKALNKSTSFIINRKSISTSQNEGFVKKIRFHWTEKLLPFELVSEKIKENGFH